jgi:hypothetical protein
MSLKLWVRNMYTGPGGGAYTGPGGGMYTGPGGGAYTGPGGGVCIQAQAAAYTQVLVADSTRGRAAGCIQGRVGVCIPVLTLTPIWEQCRRGRFLWASFGGWVCTKKPTSSLKPSGALAGLPNNGCT